MLNNIEVLYHSSIRIKKENSILIVKETLLTNKKGTVIYCRVNKTIYIADKTYFKNRKALKEVQ